MKLLEYQAVFAFPTNREVYRYTGIPITGIHFELPSETENAASHIK